MTHSEIYNQGKLEFLIPIKFLHEKFNLIVEIPDKDIVTPTPTPKITTTDYQLPDEVIAQAKAMEEELDRVRNSPPTINKSSLLTAKQQQQMEAFALHNEAKELR